MELILALACGLLVVAVILLVGLLRRSALGESPDPGAAVEPVDPSPVPTARADLAITSSADHWDLRLGDQPLMSLERWHPSAGEATSAMSGTFAAWIGTMLDNPRVLEFIAGERWVLAKVPQAIRDGGKWMESGGVAKAVARGPGTSQFGKIAELVPGGAAVGAAAALGPAIIGGAAIAYAHHEITAGLDRIENRIGDLDRRMQAADLGIIEGSRRLLREMEEWGPPHRWPEQLRWELAVRRAALDPVCFTQRATVDRLIQAMLRDGEKFVGLNADQRADLQQSLEVLSLATMTRAQIGFATTMVLLDGHDAPFGLERLNRLTLDFTEEMRDIVDDLQAALDGERPGRVGELKNKITFKNRKKIAPTEAVVADLLTDLAAVASAVDGERESAIVLTVEDGELQVAVPQRALDPGEERTDAQVLKAAIDASSTEPQAVPNPRP